MLNAVPQQIARANRQMVIRHPNSMQCVVFRKRVLRTADAEVGGNPVIGGIGVLDSEDEADFTFDELGEARVLFAGTYTAASGNIIDSEDGVIYAEGTMECRIEPVVEGAFEVDKHDRITVMPGMGFLLDYEVVGVTSPTSIPPYVRKFVVEPRQDQTSAL